MTSVPFSASSHIWDAFNLDGVLEVGPSALVVEYEGEWTKYDDNGKPGITTQWEATHLEIPFGEITAIRLKRSLFGQPQVLLLARSVKSLGGFPLAKGVQCTIPVPRRHYRDAERVVVEVEMAMADAELRRLGHGLGPAAEPQS